MTNAELLAKIKAEIERRIKECEATYPKDKDGYWFPEQEGAYAIAKEYKQLLSFLSTLESEKPIQDELKREIEAQLSIFPYTKVSPELPESRWIVIRKELYMFARHFAQWGAEHAKEQSKPKVGDGLETEALRSAGVLLSEHFEDEDDDAIRTTALRCWKGGVIHGASWQKEQMLKDGNVILAEEDFNAEKEKSVEWGYNLCKEQMMKEAVAVEVVGDKRDLRLIDSAQRCLFNAKRGDWLKIIIVKEDEK